MKQPEEAALLPLEGLALKLPKPQKKHLDAILDGTSEQELVAIGTTIASSRIITDEPRIFNEAWSFYEQASPAQRAILRGFSPALLAVAVNQAIELQRMLTVHETNAHSSGRVRSEGETSLSVQFSDAIGLRDQAYGAMRDAAHAKQLLASLDACVGTAESADALAFGLTEVGGLLRSWLKSGDSGLLARLDIAGLDASYADEMEAAAKALRTATAKAAARGTAAKITQGALDRQDGIAFILLRQIVRAFESAHDRSPTIPRLVPIATRRLFNRAKKKKDETTTAGGSTTGQGAGTGNNGKGDGTVDENANDAATKGDSGNASDNQDAATKGTNAGDADNQTKPADGTKPDDATAKKAAPSGKAAGRDTKPAPMVATKAELKAGTPATTATPARGAKHKKKGRRRK
jgi:hypothetical protein